MNEQTHTPNPNQHLHPGAEPQVWDDVEAATRRARQNLGAQPESTDASGLVKEIDQIAVPDKIAQAAYARLGQLQARRAGLTAHVNTGEEDLGATADNPHDEHSQFPNTLTGIMPQDEVDEINKQVKRSYDNRPTR